MAETAVFDKYAGIGSVVRIFIRPGSLAALERNEVVAGSKAAALDMHVFAAVQVDAVGGGCPDGFYGSIDVYPADYHPGALVKVDIPEG